MIRGGDVRVANVLATGGSTENVMGGNGGAITVTARGRATLGTVASDGGDSGANGRGGNAAPIDVTSARKSVIDSVTARGAGGGRSGRRRRLGAAARHGARHHRT